MSRVTPLLAELREFFTMRAIESRVRDISAADRTSFRAEARQLDERLRAAEALWNARCIAQACRLLDEALDLASALGRHVARLADDASDEQLAAALRLSPDFAHDLEAARRAVLETPWPTDDAAVAPAHVRAFPRLLVVVEHLARAVSKLTMTGPEVKHARRRRGAVTAGVVVASFVVVFLILRAQRRVRAEASAVYSAAFEPARVLDGNKDTEWLLPDGYPGWLDLRLAPRRPIKALRLVNAHNWHYKDRGTKEFNVELWSRGKLIKVIDGAFGEPGPESPWVTIDLATDVPLDRIRINVKSHYFAGGGLGEVALVE